MYYCVLLNTLFSQIRLSSCCITPTAAHGSWVCLVRSLTWTTRTGNDNTQPGSASRYSNEYAQYIDYEFGEIISSDKWRLCIKDCLLRTIGAMDLGYHKVLGDGSHMSSEVYSELWSSVRTIYRLSTFVKRILFLRRASSQASTNSSLNSLRSTKLHSGVAA
jgi:hypothetical protein